MSKNILVYVKTKGDKKFNALSSLKNFTYAPNLMCAVLIPYEKLERLKEWANSFTDLCEKNEVRIELRHYKGKSIHSVG